MLVTYMYCCLNIQIFVIHKFHIIFFSSRIARFLRQSFRQSIRRFRGESVDSPQPGVQSNANLRGRQARGKLNPEFAAPPDYATVIIETTRHR